MKRVKSMIWQVMLIGFMAICFPQLAHAATKIELTNEFSRNGNDIYYTLGVSTADIKKINVNTKKITTVARGEYYEVFAGDQYLFATEDTGGGGGYNSYTIYRLNKDGSNRKMMAHGNNPVQIGKYLYYTKMNIESDGYWSYYMDSAGIYRIPISGGKEKCVVKGSDVSLLGRIGNRLFFHNSNGYYSVKINGKGMKKINYKGASINYKYVGNNYDDGSSISCNGYKYVASGKKLYAVKNGNKKLIFTAEEQLRHVWRLGNRIVVSEQQLKSGYYNGYYCYYYVMKPDGSNKTLLYEHSLAG